MLQEPRFPARPSFIIIPKLCSSEKEGRKWDEVMDALYYNLIAKHTDTFEKIYATASSVYRWKSFSEEKKKQLIDISKAYINHK